MSLSKINSALIQSVVESGFDLPASLENQSFKPPPSSAWMAVYVIPNQPSVGSLGLHGSDEHDGILQITLNYPQNEGSGKALAKVDEIRSVFKAGHKLVYEGQEVTVLSCGRSKGIQENGWYTLIITINWEARTLRS